MISDSISSDCQGKHTIIIGSMKSTPIDVVDTTDSFGDDSLESSSTPLNRWSTATNPAEKRRKLFSVGTWPKSLKMSNGFFARKDLVNSSPIQTKAVATEESGETTPQSTMVKSPLRRHRNYTGSCCSSTMSARRLKLLSRSIDSSNRFGIVFNNSIDEFGGPQDEDNNMIEEDSIHEFEDVGGKQAHANFLSHFLLIRLLFLTETNKNDSTIKTTFYLKL